jgi:hypothetical protein
MLFHSWMDLLRIVAVGAPAYLALLFLLRISGNGTLSKLNAFDLVITVPWDRPSPPSCCPAMCR